MAGQANRARRRCGLFGSLRLRPLTLVVLLALGMLATPRPASAQCSERRDARTVGESVHRAALCNDKILRAGPGVSCRQISPPACADSLVGDAIALGYGANNPPAAGVNPEALRLQLKCQRLIGRAVSAYVSELLHLLTQGVPPDRADAKASRAFDRLAARCDVPVVEDASGVVLPAVGAQCAAAVGAPGSRVEGESLADCLHTLLRVWVDRVGPDPQPLRPNIVFVLTDDQRWDATGATHSPRGIDVMPRVRAELGGAGVEFANAFVTTPLCCPSRTSILTGRYAHHTGVHSNRLPNGGAVVFDDSSTLGTWLEAAGYRTGLFGKYLNGYENLWDPSLGEPPYVPPGWSEWHAFERSQYFNYRLIRNGTPVFYGKEEADYSTDVLRDLAVKFIESSVARGKPFFLYLNLKAAHGPARSPLRHLGTFDGIVPWRPGSYNEADVSDKPTWVQSLPLLDDAEQADLDLTRQQQLQALQAVDEAIGGSESFGIRGILEALRDNGVRDDTIVIYFSDNGFAWGEHRLSGKNCPYEECLRSPLFVRYPKLVPLPRMETRPALNLDFAPTLAALAGATPTVAVDGRSLERLLDGTATTWRTDFLAEGYREGRVFALVREPDWKYVETVLDETTLELEVELYDLRNDPLELENRAADPAHAARLAAMAARLRELRPGWPEDGVGTPVDPIE